MDGLVSIYKPYSYTPLQLVNSLRTEVGVKEGVKVAYAGRLDPMASGVLPIMIGEHCKERDIFQKLDKVYQFNVLFGIKTDTLDPMGLIEKVSKISENIEIDNADLGDFEGVICQRLPLYSSFHLNGTPLYKLARDGQISDDDRPVKEVHIHSLKMLGSKKVPLSTLISTFKGRIERVKGDFRQDQIIRMWTEKFEDDVIVQTARFESNVSTGTYIRSLAEQIAQKYDTFGIAYNIRRTRVGEFNIFNSLYFKNEED